MPEFVLDRGSPETAKSFAALDSFTQGYVEAMFFTEEENLCEEGGRDMPSVVVNMATMETCFEGGNSFGFADLAPDSLARIIAECQQFQNKHAALLQAVYGVQGKYEHMPYDAKRAGNDYWYTRNGHGTGFWDRGLGKLGDKLAAAARYSERYLCVGDDGRVHVLP